MAPAGPNCRFPRRISINFIIIVLTFVFPDITLVATAFGIGRGAVAGGAALGLGALAFYGLGMSQGTSAWNNSMMWPQYVRDRIRSTYLYFGGSIGISALAAAAVFRTPALLNIVGRGGWVVRRKVKFYSFNL